jgi:hypothetical protein
MAAIPGTVVIDRIVPTDTADTFPTHEAQYGKGGFRSVKTIDERDEIPTPRREIGMQVLVIGDEEQHITYELKGGITNGHWVVKGAGPGDGSAEVARVQFIATNWTPYSTYHELSVPVSVHQRGLSPSIVEVLRADGGSLVNISLFDSRRHPNGNISLYSTDPFSGEVAIV